MLAISDRPDSRPRQPLVLAAILLALLSVGLADPRLAYWPDDVYSLARWLGRATGLAGMMLYACAFLLSQRLHCLDRWLGGLPVAARWHHRVGTLALTLLLCHPLLLAGPRLEDSLSSALGYLFNFASETVLFGWLALAALLAFLLFTLLIRLPYHLWKISHLAAGGAFVIAVVHVFLASEEFALVRLVLGMAALLALLAFARQILRRQMPMGMLSARVEKVQALDRRTSEIFLRPASKLVHKPGQFAYLRVRSAPGRQWRREWHPFTIASGVGDELLRFCIRNCGDDTARWQQLQPGDEMLIEGPFGQFFAPAMPTRGQVWIAGGIGITPFLGRVRSAPLEAPTVLHYFVNSQSEALFVAELQQVAGLRLILHAADQSGLPAVAALGDIPCSGQFFVCGPPRMQQAIIAGLRKLGIPKQHIFHEEFALL